MVKGLDVFLAHFRSFNDRFVLIGGTACDMAMTEAGLEFRATKREKEGTIHISKVRLWDSKAQAPTRTSIEYRESSRKNKKNRKVRVSRNSRVGPGGRREPRRDLVILRGGFVARLKLYRQLEARGTFIPVLFNRDSLGTAGADTFLIGIRYRWATGLTAYN